MVIEISVPLAQWSASNMTDIPTIITWRQNKTNNNSLRLGTVAHTYNLRYLGGRDRKNPGLRPAWASSEISSQQTSQPW
jgi:hypothetical protein